MNASWWESSRSAADLGHLASPAQATQFCDSSHQPVVWFMNAISGTRIVNWVGAGRRPPRSRLGRGAAQSASRQWPRCQVPFQHRQRIAEPIQLGLPFPAREQIGPDHEVLRRVRGVSIMPDVGRVIPPACGCYRVG